jgi:hypothetical protein
MKRLLIFLSLTWVFFWFTAVMTSYSFDWEVFLGFGVFPVAFIWGVVWVVAGFRQKKG